MFNFFKSSTLSQEKAYAEMQTNKTIKLLDVRTREEFKDGHIAGSVNLPLDMLPQRLSGMLPNKDAKIFVICLSGSRAANAVSFMKKAGYTDVHNIGGVSTWHYGLTRK